LSSIKSNIIDALKIFDVEKYTIEQIRLEFNAMVKKRKPLHNITVEKETIANLSAEWVIAANVPKDKEQMILYFHGGGFFCGSCDTHRNMAAIISEASGVRVLLVEYRLAPEHKYPAANDDCLAAYRWLIDNGVTSEKIVIGGDSAGGSLAIMTLIVLRDAGDPLPAAAFVMSPPVDLLNFDGESYISRAELDPMNSLKGCQIIADNYIGSTTIKPPILSPINLDLGGLPPLLIQVGDHEVLLSDSVKLAERTKKANVDVTLEVWDNMWHGFQSFAAIVPEAKQAVDNIGQFVRKHLVP
jgi:acetyl esterase/lipase